MTEQDIYKRYKSIRAMIDSGNFSAALDSFFQGGLKGTAAAELATAADTYKYMMAYFLQSKPGSVDTSRKSVYNSLSETLYRLNDSFLVQSLMPGASTLYFSRLRGINIARKDLNSEIENIKSLIFKAELEDEAGQYSFNIHRDLELAGDDLFGRIWTDLHLSARESSVIYEFLGEETAESGYAIKCLVLGALLLGCLQYYDREKLMLLIRTSISSDEVGVQARALTAVLLLLWKHQDRILPDKEIQDCVKSLSEHNEIPKALRAFVLSMLRTIDTDRINKKMRDELLPEIMRLKPDIEKRIRDMGDNPYAPDLEENPDWQELLDKSGMTEKLKSFTEIQMEGGDVFMSAFSQMKGFPFFRTISNWFLPFSLSNTALIQLRDMVPATMVDLFISGPHFCSSDRYSMAMALTNMPKAQFDMMTGQLASQLSALEDERKTSLYESAKLPLEVEMNLFLKDLFRFFRLSPIKGELPDLFGTSFALPQIEPFASLAKDRELVRAMAEFYFKYGYWAEAVTLLDKICTEADTQTEDILQKAGYCYQKMGNLVRAVEIYRKAELLNPDSVWLMRHLASCLRSLGNYTDAVCYYRHALDMRPDNPNILLLLGHTLLESGDVREALKCYYQVDYMDNESGKAIRPIAWCEFLNGNFSKSIELYRKLDNKRTSSDWLNTGHAYLASGDISNASAAYKVCIERNNGNVEKFRHLMSEDNVHLLNAGVDTIDIKLITDAVTSN